MPCGRRARAIASGTAGHDVAVDLDDVAPVGVLVAGRRDGRGDALDVGQGRVEQPGDAATVRDVVPELGQLAERDGPLQLREPVVQRERAVVRVGLAVGPGLVDERAHRVRAVGVVGE